jgi:Fructose-1-6-bisphosphatase, N-terminal domain
MKIVCTATVLVAFLSGGNGFQAPKLPTNAGTTTPGRTATALNAATIDTIKKPVLDEVCETTGVTLKRYMNEVAMLNPELTELVTLFGAIDTACKAISNMVKRSQLPSSETLGYQGEVNIQGEDQKKLDVITNDVLKRALRFTGRLGVLASEEEDVPVSLKKRANPQRFHVECIDRTVWSI